MINQGYSEAYASAAGIQDKLETGLQHSSLPRFPGEDSLKHISEKWIETCVARLAGWGLLSVARGGMTQESLELKDTPQLPALPLAHASYQRRFEARHRIAAENAQRAEKRYGNEMRAWNKLYQLVYASVEGKPRWGRKRLERADAEGSNERIW